MPLFSLSKMLGFYVSYEQSCFAIDFLSVFCVDKLICIFSTYIYNYYLINGVCILTIVIIVDHI
jgi:hypothetical protein